MNIFRSNRTLCIAGKGSTSNLIFSPVGLGVRGHYTSNVLPVLNYSTLQWHFKCTRTKQKQKKKTDIKKENKAIGERYKCARSFDIYRNFDQMARRMQANGSTWSGLSGINWPERLIIHTYSRPYMDPFSNFQWDTCTCIVYWLQVIRFNCADAASAYLQLQ